MFQDILYIKSNNFYINGKNVEKVKLEMIKTLCISSNVIDINFFKYLLNIINNNDLKNLENFKFSNNKIRLEDYDIDYLFKEENFNNNFYNEYLDNKPTFKKISVENINIKKNVNKFIFGHNTFKDLEYIKEFINFSKLMGYGSYIEDFKNCEDTYIFNKIEDLEKEILTLIIYLISKNKNIKQLYIYDMFIYIPDFIRSLNTNINNLKILTLDFRENDKVELLCFIKYLLEEFKKINKCIISISEFLFNHDEKIWDVIDFLNNRYLDFTIDANYDKNYEPYIIIYSNKKMG